MVTIKDKDIQRIIDLVKKNGIGELEIHDGKQVIRVQSAPSAAAVVTNQTVLPAADHAPEPVSPPKKPSSDRETTINAPLIGTVYLTPSPDEPPFVKLGQHLKKDQTVCLIEAMKTFNHIKSPISGKLVDICVQNGDTIEYDKPMFVVESSK
jgi:acetyl-CoA carboxylase biotin carboxyl carrier protein